MSIMKFRLPGNLTERSIWYTDLLLEAGWREDVVNQLKRDLTRFESAAIMADFEECLDVTGKAPFDEAHMPFLEKLHAYMQRLTAAERAEELQEKAINRTDKDCIAANAILSKMTNGKDSLPAGNREVAKLIVNVKPSVEVKDGT